MNTLEKRLVEHTKKLIDNHSASGIKAEFEAEGTRFDELLRLKEIALRAGLGITLKIGGAEDVWGILQARDAGVSAIVAPMVESAYALSKFLAAAKKHIPDDERMDILLAVNVETSLAHQNLNAMLELGANDGLGAVTLGRVDMAGSLGIGRGAENSEAMNKVAMDVCTRSKLAGFMMTMGGSIDAGAYPIIRRLVEQKVLDRFETRKIIFELSAISDENKYLAAVREAHRFELLWLEIKSDRYRKMADEDWDRIPMLRRRVEGER